MVKKDMTLVWKETYNVTLYTIGNLLRSITEEMCTARLKISSATRVQEAKAYACPCLAASDSIIHK